MIERSGVRKRRIIYLERGVPLFILLGHAPLEVVKMFSISVDSTGVEMASEREADDLPKI